MAGLIIFGVVAAYVALWFYVVKAARNRTQRIVALLVAVLIPFWDLPIGYFQYRHHCSNEGGMRVYERIAPQDKLYFESVPSDYPSQMLKQGFNVVELRRADGKAIEQYEIREGKAVVRTAQNPESLVAVSIMRNERLAWNMYRDRRVARWLSPDKVIATYTTFSWHGGWLQESSWPLFRGSLDCFLQRTDPLVTLLRHGS